MANIRLSVPASFNFSRPDDWTKWKKRFDQYRIASGLAEEDEIRQVSMLLYCMGDEADTVLTSTGISQDDRKKYERVIATLDAFFKVRTNVIYERAKFNRRDQREGESVEQYISALYELVESCEYGRLRDEMLRDRIVVGIRDLRLSERLQMDANLTLDNAKKAVRQKEAVHKQTKSLQGDGSKQNPVVVDELKGSYVRKKTTSGGKNPGNAQQCTRCGQEKHASADKCPAQKATCHKCKRKGHYSSVCFSKTVASATQELEEVTLDDVYLDTVTSKQGNAWHITLLLEQTKVCFKMDTGAEVTAISDKVYGSLSSHPALQPTNRALLGPARQKLKVLGQFQGTLTTDRESAKQTIM